MRIRTGLRLRIAVSFALLSLLLVIGQTAAVIRFTEQQEDNLIKQVLGEEMRGLRESYRHDPEIQPPWDRQFKGYIVRGPRDLSRLPPYLRALPLGDSEFWLPGGRQLQALVEREGDTTFYLAHDVTWHQQWVREFIAFNLLGVVLVAGLATLLGYWLSGVLMRQVLDLARRVARLDPHQEQAPLAQDYGDEVVVRLARAFDQYHKRMAELLRREKEFTANLSHELRTPLTSIRTGCELLLRDTALRGKARERIAILSAAGERMHQVIGALLFLARETPPAEVETVNLKETVEEAVAPFREILAAGGAVSLVVEVPEQSCMVTHRAALQLVLGNLVRNAVNHTSQGCICVRYADHGLSVSDTGSGIACTDLPHIFDRFYRGTSASAGPRGREGSGLGLAIVRQIVERLGWRIDVASAEGKGSTFTIEFPAGLTKTSQPDDGFYMSGRVSSPVTR